MNLIVALAVGAVSIAATLPPGAQDWDDNVYLALLFTGEYEAPAATVETIAQDRAAIEAAFPEAELRTLYRNWEPGQLVCTLTPAAWSDYITGGLPELRQFLQDNSCVVVDTNGTFFQLDIGSYRALHPEVLVTRIKAIDGVAVAYPFGHCCDGNTIEVRSVGPTSRYVYRRAWGDCLMGCIYKYFWEFEVTGGAPRLVAEWGDALATESESWGALKSRY